jgi:hypothetical protein
MKSTRGLALLTSIISSSLIAVSLSVGAPTVASAAEDDTLDACYPPGRGGAACLTEEHTTLNASSPKPGTSPLPTPEKPTTQEAKKAAVALIKNDPNLRPVALSSSVTLGGNSKTVQSSATAKTGKGSVAVSTKAGATTQIKAGPYAPRSAGGYIQVWISTSDNVGMIEVGRFIADQDGYIVLPAVTLDEGALATFILREECYNTKVSCYSLRKGTGLGKRPTKAGQSPQVSFSISRSFYGGGTVKRTKSGEYILDRDGRKTYNKFRLRTGVFIYNGKAYKEDDYVEGTTSGTILVGRSILSVSASAS